VDAFRNVDTAPLVLPMVPQPMKVQYQTCRSFPIVCDRKKQKLRLPTIHDNANRGVSESLQWFPRVYNSVVCHQMETLVIKCLREKTTFEVMMKQQSLFTNVYLNQQQHSSICKIHSISETHRIRFLYHHRRTRKTWPSKMYQTAQTLPPGTSKPHGPSLVSQGSNAI